MSCMVLISHHYLSEPHFFHPLLESWDWVDFRARLKQGEVEYFETL